MTAIWRGGALVLALLVLAFLGSPARAAEVSVAVAANFAAPMQKLVVLFEQDTGHKVLLALGSTGRFEAQIRNGAPFQMLLAADEDTAARLERGGLGIAGTRFTYASGRLALWSAQPQLVDDQGDVLRRGQFDKLALADPRLAPYGAAAVATLTKMGLLAQLAPKMVQGESIAQAYQFVVTGNAQLGFVALSQIYADGKVSTGSAWVVPDRLHPPMRQDAIVLNAGRGNPAAAALAAFLKGDKARAVMRAFGYEF